MRNSIVIDMVELLPGVAGAVLALLFAWAGFMKAFMAERWRQDLRAYRLARVVRAIGFLATPWLEISIALLLLTSWREFGAVLALASLTTFSLTIVRARVLQGTNKLSCGCFGGSTARDYRTLLLRNLALGALCVVVLLMSAGREAPLVPLRFLPAIVGILMLLAIVWTIRQANVYVRGLREA
jgi:hypothetical protein